LFQINTKAYELSNTEVKNKLRTVSEGLYKDSVLDKMAGTFKALSNLADFTASSPSFQITEQPESESAPKPEPGPAKPADAIFKPGLRIGGLVYNIQIQLPESRDGAVYDALFKSLKEHLL
jgi:hypothetical protein